MPLIQLNVPIGPGNALYRLGFPSLYFSGSDTECFGRWSFDYVQTASAGNERTRNKKIYDSGDDIDGHACMTLVRGRLQNHRATTLHARATSASLARD